MPRIFNLEAVFLDTEVFVTEGFHFASKKMSEICTLASGGKFQLIIPSITVKECKKRIEKMLRAAKATLRENDVRPRLTILQQTSIDCTFLRGLDINALSLEIKIKFDQFLISCKADIFTDTAITAESILDAYFDGLAPFGQEQKKDQFPDAVAIVALSNWQAANSKVVHVVSGDKDFLTAAKTNSKLIVHHGVAEFLDFYYKQEEEKAAEVTRMVEEKTDQIVAYITNEFSKLGFILLYEDGDVDEITVDNVTINDLSIVSLHDEYASAELGVTVNYTVEVNYEDPDTGWYDKEDGMYFGRESVNKSVSLEKTFTVQLELSWDENNFDVDVSLGLRDIEIELDDLRYY